MTFKHKLSARLALMREIIPMLVAAVVVSCGLQDGGVAPPVASVTSSPTDTIFAENFESGTLDAWQDGVDPTRHRVATDSNFAHSGAHYLDVTYPAGSDGGWLTRFFMPGYDSLYVSYWVRFPANWLGGTKLIAFYGSRTDNQWSAFGKAGMCPNGTDFFAAMLVTTPSGSQAATNFYSYYPAMAREPDGVTCYGRFGDGTESYAQAPLALGAWHHIEFWVKLNTPGQSDAVQTFWIDGVQRGTWSGISFRSSSILMLNSVQLTFSTGGAPQTQHVYVDDVVVTAAAAIASPPPPPPPPPPVITDPGTVNDLAVTGATDTSVTVSFTDVDDGTGKPASYDVRAAAGSLTWWLAGSVTHGSCATPLAGVTIGAKRSCSVTGLSASTGYQVQVVAFRGTLDVDAVFGGLSNVASGSTVASAPRAVASVVVTPAPGSVPVGKKLQLSATIADSSGNVLTGRAVTWTSSAPAIATVSAAGLVTGIMTGKTIVTATSEGISGSSTVTVTAVKPGTVGDLKVSGTSDSSVTLSFTQVNDGTGRPAKYDVRVSSSPLSWGSAASVTQGACATPVAGTAIGAKLSCTVLGLTASTAYQFELVAFRGTLNVNAVFGGLSNVASGTTLADPVVVQPPPPPPPLPPPPPPPTLPTGVWPNQPSGFRVFNDQPWDLLTGSGWNWLRRASSLDPGIAVDASAPFSPLNELQMVFTPDMGNDQEPSVHWLSLPGIKEIYTGFWIKLSSNWTASPAGAGKITFLFTNGAGQVYTGYYHKGGDPVNGWVNGPPYRIGVNTEWAPYGQAVWLPNQVTTFINPGEWHRVEVYYKWETVPGSSGDGIIRWWVDGVLNGDYPNIHYPASSFSEFQFAPTLQNPPPATQYMWVDHTYVSTP